jgi:hypothetical protein
MNVAPRSEIAILRQQLPIRMKSFTGKRPLVAYPSGD